MIGAIFMKLGRAPAIRSIRFIFSIGPSSIAPARRAAYSIGSNEFVRPNRDGLGTFGGVTQRQVRHAKDSRFPL